MTNSQRLHMIARAMFEARESIQGKAITDIAYAVAREEVAAARMLVTLDELTQEAADRVAVYDRILWDAAARELKN